MSKKSTTQKKPKVISGVPEKVTHVPPLTIKKLADKLVEIEKKEGYQMALVAVECLNYQEVCKLACDKGKDNDPHLMPSRFMILYGATDEGLKKKKNLDKFPHELHDDIDEEMSVERLRYYLGLMGYYQGPWRHLEEDQDEDDDSDAEEHDISATLQGDLFGALCNYIKEAQEPFLKEVAGGTYKAGADESFSELAGRYGIRNWRILWEMNKGATGVTCDVIKEGAELKLPDSTKISIREWMLKNKWDDQYLADKGYQYPAKVLSYTLMDIEGEVLKFEKARAFQIYLKHPRIELLVEAELKAGDEVDFLIPDSPDLAVWLEGENLMFSDAVDCRFEDYVAQFDLQLEKQQSMQPKDKDVVADDLYGPPSEEDDDWFHLPDFKLPSFDLPKLPSFDLPNFQRPDIPKVPDVPSIPSTPSAPKIHEGPKVPKKLF